MRGPYSIVSETQAIDNLRGSAGSNKKKRNNFLSFLFFKPVLSGTGSSLFR